MKRLIIPSALGLSLAVLPLSVVMAVSSRTSATPTATATPTPASNLPTPTPTPATVPAAQQAAHLALLKTHGAAEINRRITSLQASLTALGTTTKLSSADKATLTSQVQTEITGLQTLATKLAAETTLAGARTDVQSIFDGYRVYALMLPKIRLVVTDDNFVTIGASFNTLANALQDQINTAKSKGHDTTAAQTELTAMEAKLDDAKTKYTGLADKVINLDPSDYDANHAVLAGDRDALVAARADFTVARTDVNIVLDDLNGTSPSPSASASPTPTATPVTTVNK